MLHFVFGSETYWNALHVCLKIKDIFLISLFLFKIILCQMFSNFVEIKLCVSDFDFQDVRELSFIREMRLASRTVLVHTIRNDLDVDGRLGWEVSKR